MQLLLLIKKIGRIFPVILCSVQNFTRIMGDRKEGGSGGFSWENVAKHKTHISDFTFQISHFLPLNFIFIFDLIALNNLTSCLNVRCEFRNLKCEICNVKFMGSKKKTTCTYVCKWLSQW